MGGYRTRSRKVLRLPTGEGACPAEHDPERLDRIDCNATKCPSATPKCASKVDVVFLVDGSGSAGQDGFNAFQKFAQSLAERMNVDADAGSQVGIITYGSTPTVSLALAGDAAAVTSSLSAMTWLKTDTNTAAALAVARAMLSDKGRVGAQPVVVVISDGSPISSHITSDEVDRLKAQGVRMTFVTVGGGISRTALEKWASWPQGDNILKVPAYGDLNEEKATQWVVKTCPKLTAT